MNFRLQLINFLLLLALLFAHSRKSLSWPTFTTSAASSSQFFFFHHPRIKTCSRFALTRCTLFASTSLSTRPPRTYNSRTRCVRTITRNLSTPVRYTRRLQKNIVRRWQIMIALNGVRESSNHFLLYFFFCFFSPPDPTFRPSPASARCFFFLFSSRLNYVVCANAKRTEETRCHICEKCIRKEVTTVFFFFSYVRFCNASISPCHPLRGNSRLGKSRHDGNNVARLRAKKKKNVDRRDAREFDIIIVAGEKGSNRGGSEKLKIWRLRFSSNTWENLPMRIFVVYVI